MLMIILSINYFKMKFKLIIISIFIVFIINNKAESQSIYQDSGIYNNSITLNITPNPFWGFIHLDYERRLFSTEKHRFSAEAGFGFWVTWGASGTMYKLKINDLYGKKNHHIEAGIGIAALYDKENYNIGVSNANYFSEDLPTKLRYTDFHPTVSLGYAFKKPDGNFIFRSGIS